ncbi:MAG: Ig-like domain repeat protein, partial [Dehalococcoidales bacterium]|nr:Ig-like domain repeat protein [Dehalococcoidales bacterium]
SHIRNGGSQNAGSLVLNDRNRGSKYSGLFAGATIYFTLNGNEAGSAVTGIDGVANVMGADLSGIDAGIYDTGVGAGFDGDTNYAASSMTATLTVSDLIPVVPEMDAFILFGLGLAGVGGFIFIQRKRNQAGNSK